MNDAPQPSIYAEEPPHASKGSKLAYKFALAAFVVIAFGLGLYLKWAIQSDIILKVNNAPFPARVISQDGDAAIVLSVDACKTQDVEGVLRVSYVSKTREIFLPVVRERGPVGCGKRDMAILVPKDLPTDTYHIKFRTIYNLNPVKGAVVQDFDSQPVKITSAVDTLPTLTPVK